MASAGDDTKPQTTDGDDKHAFKSSHYDWARDMKGREVDVQKPKQIESSEPSDASGGNGSGSAWNTAGTW